MKRCLLLLLISFLLFAASVSLEPTAAQAQTPGPDIGAFLPLEDEYNPSPWDFSQFQTNTQHHLDIFLWYQAIGEEINTIALLPAAQNGSLIQLAWLPWDPSAPDLVNQPAYKLTNITNGNFDADIHRWAGQIRDFGYPVLFRPMGEMNGNWTSWGCGNAVAGVAPVNGNSPADYVAAYRHVHDIFVADGVTNVEWVWAPNRDGAANGAQGTDVAQYTFNTYYPGDSYVDFIGIDGYNWGNEFPAWPSSWQDLGQIFGPSYDVFVHSTLNSSPKPKMMIAEMSSTENGAPTGTSKASWITAAYGSWLPYRFPEVENVTWFNQNKPEGAGGQLIDWRITSTISGQNAFNSAMQSLNDRSYFMNWYDNVGGDNWVMAGNPAPVNNSNDISPNLYIADGSQPLTPSEITPNTTSYAVTPGLMAGAVRLTTHQLDDVPVTHTSTKSVVSQRTLWPKNGNSLEEVTSRDYANLSDHYYWPWYDQQSLGMTDLVVVANLNPFPIYYEIKLTGNPVLKGIIQPNQSASRQYPGGLAGPLEVQTWVADPVVDPSLNMQKKLTPAYSVPSQRVLYNYYGNLVDFTETNGIPASELSDHYVWTWYDWQSPGAKDWVLIANPGQDPVNYTVKIAGDTVATGTLQPPNDQVKAHQFVGTMNGPVEVIASGIVIASQRVIWHYDCSFEEVPGLPYSSLGNQYFWPWYDMTNPAKNTDWILIENPNATAVTYTIKIAGQQMQSGSIPAGGKVTPKFPNIIGGPVEVTSTGGNVITSQRVLWKGSYVVPYFNEVWGIRTS